ncbi:hypothetical protein PQ465_20320 [Sphingobacterium oryzagri]|uniref:Lipocalin-like domain-containing protein n=1 Tax=Sphingobacterium oryzagri TaxID=3025669 RepID=A0ABY7WGH7_9SPHI|nr:hypothetical protein [Sphingobacterium sp. KACC 22765]WDF68627.1 hypothetical protein PQ465_20320 [Sphingobacterium sp. KACC 22765]
MNGLLGMTKNWMFLLVGLLSLSMISCSEDTVDNIGRDTALNIIRSNKWFDVVKTTSVAGAADVTETLVGAGEELEFKSNNFAYVYGPNGETDSYAYNLETNKRMMFDGRTYEVQESIIQTVARLTLVNNEGNIRTTIVFRRR